MNALICSGYRAHAQIAKLCRCKPSPSGFSWWCGASLSASARQIAYAAVAVVLLILATGATATIAQSKQSAPINTRKIMLTHDKHSAQAYRVAARQRTSRPRVSNARISRKGRLTTFSIRLSKPTSAQVFTLARPYRVIIDLPSVKFSLNDAGGGQGLVKKYRYGAFAPGKSRIVLDVSQPVVVRKTITKDARRADAWIFSIVMEATDDIGFLLKPPPRKVINLPRGNTSAISPARQKRNRTILKSRNRRANARPVIIIDPGHGGIDPGTIGAAKSREKHVTMAVARRLRSILRRKKRYDVFMTRTRDTFISLDERVAFSNKHGASLFISIHADAIGNKALAKKVRGATVYILSERASDDQARRLAKKENSVDALAGIQVQEGGKGVQVKTILIDLLKRETSNLSTNFSNLLLKRFKGHIAVHGRKTKAAAFHVLKQTHTPSVLIELGYMSNRRDEKSLNSIRWQKKAARAIASSIDTFFAKKLTAGR